MVIKSYRSVQYSTWKDLYENTTLWINNLRYNSAIPKNDNEANDVKMLYSTNSNYILFFFNLFP